MTRIRSKPKGRGKWEVTHLEIRPLKARVRQIEKALRIIKHALRSI